MSQCRQHSTFWLEYASTYSYPAAARIGALARKAGVNVRWRPFLLGPIFQAQGWNTSPFNIYPTKGRYMWRDLERICGDLGLPLKPVGQFPQNSLLAARVALIGFDAGWGEDFSRAVYRAEFGEGKNIAEQDVIAGILAKLGVDAARRARTGADQREQGPIAQRRPRKRSGSAFSARRVSSPPTANCSGATTGWRRRSPGRNSRA